jgi:hypothetical protein
MRDLTEEELKLAPDWATHYSIDSGDDDVVYESEGLCWWSSLGRPVGNFNFNTENNREIDRGFVDMKHHQFSDSEVESVKVFLGEGYATTVLSNTAYNTVRQSKEDIIAIAKALGVTGEDLF